MIVSQRIDLIKMTVKVEKPTMEERVFISMIDDLFFNKGISKGQARSTSSASEKMVEAIVTVEDAEKIETLVADFNSSHT